MLMCENSAFQVQPEMITLDTGALGQVDVKTLEEKMEEKKKLGVNIFFLIQDFRCLVKIIFYQISTIPYIADVQTR